MGALTSKPFSFTARSWELADRIAYDFHDTYFSALKVSFRGSSIMRILPDFNQTTLSEWISDRARFSYDSIPTTSQKQEKLFSLKLPITSVYFLNFIFKRFPTFANSFSVFKGFSDLTHAHRFKNYVSFLGFSNPFETYDFRSQFYTNCFWSDTSFVNFKNFFFVGVNVRYQLPVLAIAFRKYLNSREKYFFNFGFFTNNLFEEFNFGSDFVHFYDFLRGKTRASRLLQAENHKSLFFTTPKLKNIISTYQPSAQVISFFDSPSCLSSAEMGWVYSPEVFNSIVDTTLFQPHPFTYVSFNLRSFRYQRFDSPFSVFQFGNFTNYMIKNTLIADYRDSSLRFSVNFNSVFFQYTNFYTYSFATSFSAYSLNNLVSVKRQLDSRTNFNYYI
jgi:hypothetical protein